MQRLLSFFTPPHVKYGVFNYINLQNPICYFERNDIKFLENYSIISERSRQEGLYYAGESYIHNIIFLQRVVNEKTSKQSEKLTCANNASIGYGTS